jgi:hypothetical protein
MVAFAKFYNRKSSHIAKDLLIDRIPQFFEEYKIPLIRILSDSCTGFYCNREQHESPLYFTVEMIDHIKTKTRSPQTNRICESFQRTILNELYHIVFKKEIYNSLE